MQTAYLCVIFLVKHKKITISHDFNLISEGAFHSTQNSGNFGWYIKWNGPFQFGPTGIFRTSFEGGPL